MRREKIGCAAGWAARMFPLSQEPDAGCSLCTPGLVLHFSTACYLVTCLLAGNLLEIPNNESLSDAGANCRKLHSRCYHKFACTVLTVCISTAGIPTYG